MGLDIRVLQVELSLRIYPGGASSVSCIPSVYESRRILENPGLLVSWRRRRGSNSPSMRSSALGSVINLVTLS